MSSESDFLRNIVLFLNGGFPSGLFITNVVLNMFVSAGNFKVILHSHNKDLVRNDPFVYKKKCQKKELNKMWNYIIIIRSRSCKILQQFI